MGWGGVRWGGGRERENNRRATRTTRLWGQICENLETNLVREPNSPSGPLSDSGSYGSNEKRGWNNSIHFKDFGTKNSSSQGQILALTVLFDPSSLDSGLGSEGTYTVRS